MIKRKGNYYLPGTRDDLKQKKPEKRSYSKICKEAADKALIYVYYKHVQDRLYWTCVRKKKQKDAGDDAEPFGYIKIFIITGDK